VFVTRASRREVDEIKEFYDRNDWDPVDFSKGQAYIARQGSILATLLMVSVGHVTVIDDVLVDEDRRKEGIGTTLINAAMNNRGGTLWLCCHDYTVGYYERFGFEVVERDQLPEEIFAYFKTDGTFDDSKDHYHYVMKAR
jgi:N-acetylglutamate synthase-like GNAT family acetyltransferase